MKVSDVLRSKGSEVITIKPDETISGLLALLAEHRIGAVVVSTDGSSVEGIVSERDIVRHLHSSGTSVLEAPVSQIMTSDVTTGSADDNIADLAGTMTELRVCATCRSSTATASWRPSSASATSSSTGCPNCSPSATSCATTSPTERTTRRLERPNRSKLGESDPSGHSAARNGNVPAAARPSHTVGA